MLRINQSDVERYIEYVHEFSMSEISNEFRIIDISITKVF